MGYTPYSVVPGLQKIIDHIHPEDMEELKSKYLQTTAFQNNIQFKHRIIRTDGIIRYISSIGEINRDQNNVPEILTGVTLDVTETH